MIELLPAPDHVLAYRLAGHVSASDYDRIIETVEEKLRGHCALGVYADMTGFTDIGPDALMKDVRYSLMKFREWGRFRRAALVTDRAWLKALVSTLDPVIPHVEARAFGPDEREAAMAWAAGEG